MLLLVIFCYPLAKIACASTQAELMDALVDSSVYNRRQRPHLADGISTNVTVTIYINSIRAINEANMNYQINMYLRQSWSDSRLSYEDIADFNNSEYLVLDHTYKDSIWLPDLVLTNEAEKGAFHTVTVPNTLIRLTPAGNILLSQKVTSTLSCNMKLHKFPLDTQKCRVIMESYGHTDNDIDFLWEDIEEPVIFNKQLELPEFKIAKLDVGICSVEYITGTFSCINVDLYFERQFEFYLFQLYVPSILIVVLSWVAFWVDAGAVPARVTIGVVSVLTTSTQANGINNKLPKVSYAKAIDVWMFTATVFVFAALIEFAIVNTLSRREKAMADQKKEEKKEKFEFERKRLIARGFGDATEGLDDIPEGWEAVQITGVRGDTSVVTVELRKIKVVEDEPIEKESSFSDKAKKACSHLIALTMWLHTLYMKKPSLFVDVASRILFPCVYFCFNVIYWSHYLTKEDTFGEE